MGKYNIYHSDGTLFLTTRTIRYSDSFMGESSVVFDISSPKVVAFSIGDYVDYKGRRFYLAVAPSVSKKSRKLTTGSAFTYENVKFTSAAGYDMTRCKMRDVVLESLSSTYHTNFAATTWSLYCESLITFGERLQANLNRLFKGDDAWVVKVRLINGTDHVCDGYNAQDHVLAVGEKNVSITISDQDCWSALSHVKDEFNVNFILADKVVGGKNKKEIILGANGTVLPYFFRYGKGHGVFKFTRSTDDTQAVVTLLRAYGTEENMPVRYYNKKEGSMVGETINVRKLMLPGFGTAPLSAVVEGAYGSNVTLTNRINAAVQKAYSVTPRSYSELVQYVDFSDNPIDPYIIAIPQSIKYNIREGEVSFDGTGDYIDIHPSIEWLGDSNKIALAEQIEDNGVGEEGSNTPKKETFFILVDLDFDPSQYIPFGANSFRVSFRSGMCGGRSFECIRVDKEGDYYKLTLKREEDTSLDLWFPYKDFNISEGDEFVFTDIDMPDEYIEGTALNELLPQAVVALLDNCDTKYKYSIDVDNIEMHSQHVTAMSPADSIYNVISAGCEIWFGDEDLDLNFNADTQTVTGHVLIDRLEITESEGGIPNYSITLVDEVSVGTLESIQKQINAITSGKITINGSGGGVGPSYNEQDIQNICRALGDARYLMLTGGTISGGLGVNGNVAVRGDVNVQGVLHATKLSVDSLEIMEAKHIAGKIISSPASAEIVKIDDHGGTSSWDLMFNADDTDGNPVENMFVADDMIWCEQFRVDYGGGKYVQNKVYWRAVKSVGTREVDGKSYNYVTVDMAEIGNSKFADIPAVGDTIVVLGNLDSIRHKERQNATVSSPIGSFLYRGQSYPAPYECQYVGIGSQGFVLPDPINVKSPGLTIVKADKIELTSGVDLDEGFDIHLVDWDAQTFTDDNGVAHAVSPVDINVQPSEDWSEDDVQKHLGDMLVTHNGFVYRLVYDGTYKWEVIADDLLLKVQEQLRGLQQSGFVTEKDFAKMWSSVWSSDGAELLTEAGVITSTIFDHTANQWFSRVDIYGDKIKINANHSLSLNAGSFDINTPRFKLTKDGKLVIDTDNFSIDENGVMTAMSGKFGGSIHISFADTNDVDENDYLSGGNIVLPSGIEFLSRRLLIYNNSWRISRGSADDPTTYITTEDNAEIYGLHPYAGNDETDYEYPTGIKFMGGVIELVAVQRQGFNDKVSWVVTRLSAQRIISYRKGDLNWIEA